jgi:hypothetical protein
MVNVDIGPKWTGSKEKQTQNFAIDDYDCKRLIPLFCKWRN